jgi:hypothetical protein
MRNMVKRAAAGAVLGGSLLVTGGLGIASAVPGSTVNDQQVNLSVGTTNVLRDLNVDVAAQIAGLLCGTGTSATGTAENRTNVSGPTASGMSANESTGNVGDLAALARQVDSGQIPSTSCNSPQGVVTISKNVPAASPNSASAAGQQSEGSTSPPAQTPSPAQMPAPAGPLGPAPNS